MKQLLFFVVLLTFILGCSDSKELSFHEKMLQDGWELDDSEDFYYKYFTSIELEELANKGIYLNGSYNRSNTCRWNDGRGSSLACNDGRCRVVWKYARPRQSIASTPNQVETCLKCSSTGRIGACRE